MKNERGCRFGRHLIVLVLVSGTLLTVQLVTMALTIKDRKVTELLGRMANIEEQNRQLLSSVLAGVNGGGYSVQFDPYNSVKVSCKIDFEWVNGSLYYGDAGRKSKLIMARK